MPISSLWHLYNLRESPFFQEQLTAGPDARYSIDLFVGRRTEVDRLVRGIRGKLASSSRQTVQGRPGIGKSTLIQQVKHVVAEDGILSSPLAVRVGHADSTETVLLRTVNYVYAAILSNSQTTAIGDLEPMVTAKQLTFAFQARSGGGDSAWPASEG
jgi:ATPase subunit of ABC transporter with duplicated ATPase domains